MGGFEWEELAMLDNVMTKNNFFIRLITILIIECFIVSNIAPDYDIRSLFGSQKEAALRQARLFPNQEAPDASPFMEYKGRALHRDSPSGVPRFHSLLLPFNGIAFNPLNNPQAIANTFTQDNDYKGNSYLAPPLETGNFGKLKVKRMTVKTRAGTLPATDGQSPAAPQAKVTPPPKLPIDQIDLFSANLLHFVNSDFTTLIEQTKDTSAKAALEQTQQEVITNLQDIFRKVREETIDPSIDLKLSDNESSVTQKPMSRRTVRVGVLGGTFNPLHCGHIAFAFYSMNILNLDAVIIAPPGDFGGYKVSKLGKAHRHEIAKRALEPFAPLLRYSSYGLENDEIGPVSMALQFYRLNPDKEIKLFYLAGSDTLSSSARNLERGITEFNVGWDDFNRIELVVRGRKDFPIGQSNPGYQRLEERADSTLGVIRGLTHDFLIHELPPEVQGMSSTVVRKDPHRYPFVPFRGLKYIYDHQLYPPAPVQAEEEQMPSPGPADIPAVLHQRLFSLSHVAVLSERDDLIREATQATPEPTRVNVSCIIDKGFTRTIAIPAALHSEDKLQIFRHITALAFNLALFGGTRFLLISVEDNPALEREIVQAIQEEFDGRYQRHIRENVNFGESVRVIPASTDEGEDTLGQIRFKTLRAPHMFDQRRQGLFLGVDIGSTFIKVFAIKDGQPIYEQQGIPSCAEEGGAVFVETVKQVIKNAISAIGEEPSRVVVVIPGIVVNNVNLNFGNLERNWTDEDRAVARTLHSELTKAWGSRFEISIHNDMKGAATAISIEEPNLKKAYILWLGTGVGGAVLLNGQLMQEPTQFGMLKVAMTNDSGGQIGRVDHVQPYASAEAICTTAARLDFPEPVGLPELAHTAMIGLTKRTKGETLTKNEAIALRVMERAAEFLGENIIEAHKITHFDTTILGGGLAQSESGALLRQFIQDYLRRRAPNFLIDVRLTNLDPEMANAIGAAYLANIEDEEQNMKVTEVALETRIQQIDQQALALAQEAKRTGLADIVVMIPTHRAEPTALHVIQEVIQGLIQHYHKRQAIILITGEEERATDFHEQFKVAKTYQTKNIRVIGLLKQPQHQGKGWSLRTGMRFAQEVFTHTLGQRCVFLAIDSDIQNITADWIPQFIKPLMTQGHDLAFSSYSARDYMEDDRALKDHFTTPFLSALIGKEVYEAEGEYAIADGPIIQLLLEDHAIWEYMYPEFFFIPYAKALGKSIVGINFPEKLHHWQRYPLGRFAEYVRAYFDQALTQPFLTIDSTFAPLTSHVLPDVPSNVYVNIDPRRYLEDYQKGFRSHEAVYQNLTQQAIIPAAIYKQLKELANPQVDIQLLQRQLFTAPMWARTVFAFLEAYAETSYGQRPYLLQALTPLLVLRIASFALEINGKNFVDVRRALDIQTQLFVKERDEFLCRRHQKWLKRIRVKWTPPKPLQAISLISGTSSTRVVDQPARVPIEVPKDKASLQMVVTGATGQIGRSLVEHLLANGHQVQALVRPESPRRKRLSLDSPGLAIMEGDLLSLKTVKQLAQQQGTLYLLGAITDIPSKTPEAEARLIVVDGFVPGLIAYLRNVAGLEKQLRIVFGSSQVVFWIGPQRTGELDENTAIELAERAPEVADWIDKVITRFKAQLPQMLECENLTETLVPIVQEMLKEEHCKGEASIFQRYYPQVYPYKLAKWIGERLVSECNNVVIIRMTTSYGPGHDAESHVIPALIKAILRGEMGSYPTIIRDFTYIYDTVEILRNIATIPEIQRGINDVIHIASGKNVSPEEVKALVEQLMPGARGKISLVEAPLSLKPPHFNTQRAQELLGRPFTPFKQGLAKHIQWLRHTFIASKEKLYGLIDPEINRGL
ncbi:MAG: ROK family protein [Candidatus Omnitrophica bacterium]|nr:ROK family protein [Candidatus Omnitrophota bacterium]